MSGARWGGWRSLIARLPKADVAAAVLFVVATFAICYPVTDWNDAQYFRAQARDIWFDADVHRVYAGETDRQGGTDRTTLHPLYGYVTYPPLFIYRRLTGASGYDTVRVFHSFVGAVFIGSFFVLLRVIGLRRFDSAVVTAALGTSAASVFWLPVTETFVLGGLSMLPAVALSALSPSGRQLPHFAANVIAIGITVTNWIAALLSSWLSLPLRPFLRVAGGALAVALVGGYAYRWAFPESITLFKGAMHEAAWIFAPESGGPFAILRTFFFSSVVAPEIRMVSNFRQPAWPLLTLQHGGLMTGTAWSYLATPVWAALLACGVYAVFRLKDLPRLRVVVGVTLLYQLWLHLVYGRETFLYSMHFVPLLFVFVAVACRSKLRPVVVTLALVLAIVNAPNSFRQFSWAQDYSKRYPIIRAQEDEILRRVKVPRSRLDPTYLYRFWRDVWPNRTSGQ